MKRKRNVVEEGFLRSWWVLLFILICSAVYEQAIIRTNERIEELEHRIASIRVATERATVLQERQRQKLVAQEDPAWVELTLMRVLGMVRKGERKVFFEDAG